MWYFCVFLYYFRCCVFLFPATQSLSRNINIDCMYMFMWCDQRDVYKFLNLAADLQERNALCFFFYLTFSVIPHLRHVKFAVRISAEYTRYSFDAVIAAAETNANMCVYNSNLTENHVCLSCSHTAKSPVAYALTYWTNTYTFTCMYIYTELIFLVYILFYHRRGITH